VRLRDYQQDAVGAAMGWCRRYTAPCVIEAPTGAGKSFIIAAIADELHKISGGKAILVIAPSAELVEQDHEKFTVGVGRKASFFSASVGEKSLRYPVVFGTPQSVANSLARFGSNFCAVIIDECHRITPTVKRIIDHLREKNSLLRVIGLSATPYRLGSGYIYRQDETGHAHGPDRAREPYFAQRVFTIDAHHLIERGYLSTPTVGEVSAEGYDTSKLAKNRMGQWDSKTVDQAFVGHGRKTSAIVGDVVSRAQNRNGVMFFASTIPHAREILASLPAGLSALIIGATNKKERQQIIDDFKARRIKYLVNVDVLTTGFDASHVDVVAILRATESVALLQQIVGRGLRVEPGKLDCLVLDYAGNIARHCPDGDIFDPEITADAVPKEGETVEIQCEECGTRQVAKMNIDIEATNWDAAGYATDLTGQRIATDFGPLAVHHNRRCRALLPAGGGELVRCSYRWTSKACPECDAPNDIAARKCSECKAEIIDPNEKLSLEFDRFKADTARIQTDKVTSWSASPHVSKSGNNCKKIDVVTPYRKMRLYLTDGSAHKFVQRKFDKVAEATLDWVVAPDTITYRKNGDFWDLLDVNRPADQPPKLTEAAE